MTRTRTRTYHAKCIEAARQGEIRGICHPCYDDIAARYGADYAVTTLALHNPDGSMNQQVQRLPDGTIGTAASA
jgi:hypothetical protein